MTRLGVSNRLRALHIAAAVTTFGVILTVAIVVRDGIEDFVGLLQLLFIRLLPYGELSFAAFLLDRFFAERFRIPMVLASTILMLVDSIVTYRLFWQPQASSTDGIAMVVAMFALVLFLIPGAVVIGLQCAPPRANPELP